MICLWFIVLSSSYLCSPHRVPLPVIRVPATNSLYEAGLMHGRLAKGYITGFLSISEIKALKAFVTDNPVGVLAFENFKKDNSKAFPRYVLEMQGIADGSSVDIETIWMINMLQELENLMRQQDGKPQPDHCSDLMASGFEGIWAGHNEDWSEAVKPFMYIVAYDSLDSRKANFVECAGFCYPGMVPGSAMSFNKHGIFYTQNAMFPSHSRNSGLLSNFVNRNACEQSSWQGVAEVSNVTDQAMGFSLNVVDVKAKIAMNVEVYEDRMALTFAGDSNTHNLSHFNKYKYIDPLPQMPPRPSTEHRQKRVDSLPPWHTKEDVLRVLGDVQDAAYPIYRNITLMTLLLDGVSGDLNIWADANPYTAEPVYSWNVFSFWN
mmetsp:Transcript_7155/g.13543  ORF Transcript_7155/g.13543 Transcript_7155/m.13543 type:complete len:377 (-) Transcript_7155:102-1232(-)|eukprot:CAMPEP_0175119734 /NCGR_PEP_ID=MMETSP0087-20121206/229_1 /TAXON_ID=136419 /ORGANISM="Unknown Unknown, Strain D1" /LENGTH=376 /DNA_ID=CAMNT_0016401101 /DNA_START=20 /DNA_END=1150 /DNA_ORIENTATION=+